MSTALCRVSLTWIFAMETSFRAKSPWSSFHAARMVSSRPTSIAMAASPISHCTPSCWCSLEPKLSRSRT